MVKAVFTTKVDPTYDDLPEVRYHFPKSYLRAAEQAVGDWIIYYEPRRTSGDPNSRGGRQSYFACPIATASRASSEWTNDSSHERRARPTGGRPTPTASWRQLHGGSFMAVDLDSTIDIVPPR